MVGAKCSKPYRRWGLELEGASQGCALLIMMVQPRTTQVPALLRRCTPVEIRVISLYREEPEVRVEKPKVSQKENHGLGYELGPNTKSPGLLASKKRVPSS